ncbi:MAG: hypothetical protein GQ574_25740 [Crocinitomix sp.]|nr:hypothetical protein [Crocinitomix sp.]
MKVLRSRYFIILCTAFFCVSCGKLFRKTWFEAPKDGLVAIDHTVRCEDGKRANLKMYGPQQVETQRKGYKTQYGVWYCDKRNYWTFIELFVIPVGAGTAAQIADDSFFFGVAMTWSVILAGLIDAANGPITSMNWKYDLVKLPDYTLAESNITVMDVEHCTAVAEYEDSTAKWMSSFCEEVGFTDEDDLDISGYSDFHIYGNVKSYNLQLTQMPRRKGTYKEMTLGVNYKIIDKFGAQVIDTTIVASSGQFLNSMSEKYCYRDALDYTMLYLLSSPTVKSALQNKEENQAVSEYFQDSEEVNNLSYDNLTASVYKVHTEFGLAPLIPIAKNGLAALSHHAYDLAEDSLIIISPKGDTIKDYEILEESFTQDYVLVKTNETFEKFFSVNNASTMKTDKMARFGVTSVGFNQYLDILQGIEGKVNGERIEDNYTMYQLDLNVSDLLYPAIFSNEGQLLGFVSRTIDTRTVEGVSFFRPLIIN